MMSSSSSRALQKSNTQHDPPYWRGAKWININVLAVRALDHYRNADGCGCGGVLQYHSQLKSHAAYVFGRCMQIYHELNHNVVNHIFNKQYKSTGYVWEQVCHQIELIIEA